jgi:hypothetical protein
MIVEACRELGMTTRARGELQPLSEIRKSHPLSPILRALCSREIARRGGEARVGCVPGTRIAPTGSENN